MGMRGSWSEDGRGPMRALGSRTTKHPRTEPQPSAEPKRTETHGNIRKHTEPKIPPTGPLAGTILRARVCWVWRLTGLGRPPPPHPRLDAGDDGNMWAPAHKREPLTSPVKNGPALLSCFFWLRAWMPTGPSGPNNGAAPRKLKLPTNSGLWILFFGGKMIEPK